MKIGLIGAGAIANFLLKKVNLEDKEDLQITSVFVRDREKYQTLEEKYGIQLFTNLEEFLDSDMDIVVEAANIEAVKALLPEVIKQKEAVLISIGALADEEFSQEISELAQRYQHSIHLPSGAVGGLDLLQNAHALGTVTEVALTTRKPAHSLIDQSVEEEVIVFEGKAADAIKQFPKNINVSIVLSLAGIGMEQTKVTMIADPHIEKNMHQVEIKGDIGEANFSITNNALPKNPKTSYLAAMSILGTLKRMESRVRIGG